MSAYVRAFIGEDTFYLASPGDISLTNIPMSEPYYAGILLRCGLPQAAGAMHTRLQE